MLASIPSASLLGATGSPVRVEVHVGAGLPGYRIVGMPDAVCRESRDRVRAAVLSSRRQWPKQSITVNLAPSGTRKVRGRARPGHRHRRARRQRAAAPADVGGHGFIGELGLDGSLRRVPGVAPMVAVLGDVVAVVPSTSSAEAHVASPCGVRVAVDAR